MTDTDRLIALLLEKTRAGRVEWVVAGMWNDCRVASFRAEIDGLEVYVRNQSHLRLHACVYVAGVHQGRFESLWLAIEQWVDVEIERRHQRAAVGALPRVIAALEAL